MDTDDRFEKLTEKQRQCLRHAAEGFQEKEIALRIGTTPAAVKERLRSARQHIGVGTSREAGRLFLSWERMQAYTSRPVSYTRQVDALKVLDPGRLDAAFPSQAAVAASSDGADAELNERRAVYHIDSSHERLPVRSILFPALRRKPNDLDVVTRILIVFAEAIGLAIGFATVAFMLISLSRFLLELSHKGG
jgi:DNA-binding CsgD family transcriptional regulator